MFQELPVAVPSPCSMDTAYDGGSKCKPRRALKPLERDILCRVLGDILREIRKHQDLDSLMFDCGEHGIRMSEFEVNVLYNIRGIINPRPDGE